MEKLATREKLTFNLYSSVLLFKQCRMKRDKRFYHWLSDSWSKHYLPLRSLYDPKQRHVLFINPKKSRSFKAREKNGDVGNIRKRSSLKRVCGEHYKRGGTRTMPSLTPSATTSRASPFTKANGTLTGPSRLGTTHAVLLLLSNSVYIFQHFIHIVELNYSPCVKLLFWLYYILSYELWLLVYKII